MAEYLSKKDALASVNGLFAQKQTNSFNSGFEEAAQRTAASLKKFEQQQANKSVQPIVTPQMPKATTRQPTLQQTANYNKLQELVAKSNPVKTNTQTLASGRDFAVVPQAKPNAERDAYVADYKAKYGGSDFEAGLAYSLDNSKILTAADKLMKATNPIAATYRTAQAAEDVINTAVNGKPAEPYELGQAYIREADKARQEFRDITGNGIAGEVALAAGDMLASAGTANMAGIGLTPFLAATSGIQTAGEDVNKGRGVIPSVLHGVGSGGITYLVEGLGGIGQTKLGQTIAGKITSAPAIKAAIEKASPQVAKMLGNSIVRFIANAGQEGLEEAIEYPAQVLLENIVFDDATPFDVKEWWNNTVVGGGVGALFGGANIMANRAANRMNGVQNVPQNVTENAENVIGAKENPANPQTIGDMQGEQSTEQKIRSGLEAMRVSGVVPNDAAKKVGRRTYRALNAMGNKLGVKIMFDDTLSGENGRYDPEDRTIHIALDSQDPIGVVATHEITHRLKETSPEIYKQFKQAAFDIMRNNGSYDNVMAAVAEAYADGDPSLIEDEMAAHFTRIMTEDISAFEQLSGVNRNLAQKLLDMLDDFLRKAGWNDNMNAALDSLFGDINPQRLNEVRKSWREAIARADAGAAGNGYNMESIVTLPDGRQYVKADRNIIRGDDPIEWVKQVYNFFDRELRRGYDIVLYSSDGHELIISDDTVGKAVYNKKDGGQTVLTKEQFRRKLEAATHIDEIAKVSKYHKSKPDNSDHPHDDIDGDWKYFTSFFKDTDDKHYRVEFSVMPKRKDIIYDVTDFQKRKHPTITGPSSNNGGAPSRVLLNGLNITQPTSSVNNHSMQSKPHSRPLNPNATSKDMLAPLREKMQRATAPHPQPGGSRVAGDSAISHLGEAGAFGDVKNLLNTAASEKKKRGMGEKDEIADIADTNDMKKPRVNLQDIAQASYRKFVDSGERVSKIAKATGDKVLYPLFNNAKQARQTAQYNIGVAQTNIKGERIGKSVQEIIQPIKAKGDDYWKAFEEYIYHNHNVDSMTLSTRGAAVLQSFIEDLEAQNPILQGKSVEEVEELSRQPQHKEAATEWIMLTRRIKGIKNKPVFGQKMTAEKSKQIVGQLLFDHPEFEDFGNEVIGYYRNLINNNVDAGLISAKERDILQQLYPNYVPVMTIQSNTVADRNNRRAAVADVHKARTANNKLLMPIDEAMARKTLTSIAAQRRNIFGVRLLEQALVNRYLIGRDVQSVQDTDIPYDVDAEEEPNLPNSFRVWVDGQPAEMAVSNELMEGVNSIMPKQDDGNLFEQLLGKGNNAFKRAVTSDNPFFAISNILRDVQDAAFYSEQDLKKFFGNYGNAIKEMKNNGKYWQLYQAMGGTGNSYFDYGEGVKLPDEYSGILGKVRKGREKIEALNLYTEQAPRLAEFMGVIEKGGESYENVQKALLAAADITTNFGRSGETGKRLNKSYVPFFNPSVQGADKFVRNIVNKVEEEKWGKLIAQFAGAVLPAFWNILMWWDDEEYDLLPDNVKDNYYLVKAGNGIWLRFPKGRAIMPATNAAERMARAARGEDGAWDGYWASTMQSVAPNNPLTDNLASPIIESRIWDKNDPGRTWYGGEIEPQRLQNVAAGQRYDEKTDVLSKGIGGLLDISPKKINYLLDAYSGVYGDVYMAVPGVTPQAKRVPLVNRFYTDSVTNNRLSNDFYDALEEAKIGFNTDYNAGDRAEYQSLNKASRGLSDFYAAERDIQTSDLSRSEKLEQSRKLAADRNAFILEALEIAQREREKAESKFAGISQTDYAMAYKAQKEFSKNVDKEKAIARAVPHLSSSQRKRLYDEFKNK